jgi:hypothetical protein
MKARNLKIKMRLKYQNTWNQEAIIIAGKLRINVKHLVLNSKRPVENIFNFRTCEDVLKQVNEIEIRYQENDNQFYEITEIRNARTNILIRNGRTIRNLRKENE